MRRILHRLAAALLLAAAFVSLAPGALAQVASLYYKEVDKNGRIYVFNTAQKYEAWQKSGDMGVAVTMLGQGPNGETVVAENETALDLYNFKHDRPAYVRPAPKPAPPPGPPVSIKIGDGELKFGLLVQPWYVTDSSPLPVTQGTGTSYYGNTIGINTFRIRRSEIRLYGTIISPAWGFEVMIDPAKTQTFTATGVPVTDDKILQDLAVSFLGLKGHELGLGQKKITVTEEGVHSSSDLDFAERARVARTFSDRRETGFFYRGDYSEFVTAWASITNGTAANVVDDSNDTVFGAARLDFKPIHGLLLGASGGTSGGETATHLRRDLLGTHVRYDGTDELPIGVRFEYLRATTGQSGKADLRRDGWYGTFLYTLAKQYQFGVRYDEIDNNKDADGNKIKTVTAGFHYLVKGRNTNFKLDYFNIKQEGRKVNGVLEERYSQLVLAAQVAF